MNLKLIFVFVIFTVMSHAATAIEPVFYFDGEFAEADWSSEVTILQGNAPTGIAFQQPVAGNPGAYWRNEISLTVGDGVIMDHFADFAIYDPGTLGPIEKIDYSIDSAYFSGGNFAQHLILRQDGNKFYYSMPSVSGSVWATDSVQSLTSVNFFNRETPLLQPDFSSAGSPIEFGFTRRSFLNSGSTFDGFSGADNWDVTVHREQRVHLINAASEWRYLDDGTDQNSASEGTSWFAHPEYDDNNWQAGTGPFGYGDSHIETIVDFGDSLNNKHVTTYFRNTFDVEDVSLLDDVTVALQRDDGAAVYINGELVANSDLPLNPNFLTLASGTASGSSEYKYFHFNVDDDVLVNGTNVIAVELHQTDRTSSDLSFDLQLSASVVPEPSSRCICLVLVLVCSMNCRRKKYQRYKIAA